MKNTTENTENNYLDLEVGDLVQRNTKKSMFEPRDRTIYIVTKVHRQLGPGRMRPDLWVEVLCQQTGEEDAFYASSLKKLA